MEQWYVARVLVRCEVGEHDSGPWTCDEQVRVIRAENPERAFEKAVALGRGEEHNYKNMFGENVRWFFVGLVELEGLDADEITDGTEITSQLFKSPDPSKLIQPRERLNALWSKYHSEAASDSPEEDPAI